MKSKALAKYFSAFLAITMLTNCAQKVEISPIEGCDPPISTIVDDVRSEIGESSVSLDGDCSKKIFVFEERHDSIKGQVEMALMLYRLYKDYGLRELALEGAVLEDQIPDVSWFHRLPDEKVRNDIALQLLRQGEISAAEYMAMVFEDFRLYPIERYDEYKLELSREQSWAQIIYLAAIAEKKLSSEQIDQLNRMVEEKADDWEIVQFVIESNPWTKKHYNVLSGTSLSTLELVQMIDDISQKAQEVGADVRGHESSLQAVRNFYHTAYQRSETMLENTIALIGNESESLIAMNIGAAHTKEIVDDLKSQSISFAVLTPLSLKESQPSFDDDWWIGYNSYEQKLNSQSVDPINSIGAFLDGRRRKPSPAIDQKFFVQKAEIMYSAIVLAQKVDEDTGFVNKALANPQWFRTVLGLDDISSININPELIEIIDIDDNTRDVLFPIEIQDTQKVIWLRAAVEQPEIEIPATHDPEIGLNALLDGGGPPHFGGGNEGELLPNPEEPRVNNLDVKTRAIASDHPDVLRNSWVRS